jgi:hypothetical protein
VAGGHSRDEHASDDAPPRAPDRLSPLCPKDPAARALGLQRAAGNRATGQLLRRRAPQRQLMRNGESAKKLAELAKPDVFVGPEAALQTQLVTQLEETIATNPKVWDKYVLFLGAIQLDRIPDDEEGMIRDAKLINLPSKYELEKDPTKGQYSHALASNLVGFDMVRKAGEQAERAIIRNTLRTMIRAGQIEYLRKAKLPDDDWTILVEVHYYRERSKEGHNFHKDTYGHTLFVNLNYETTHDIAGPEFIVNPSPSTAHDKQLETTLPAQFRADLAYARTVVPKPTEIEFPKVPAGGVVVFVDEAIHHMTPLYDNRTVTGDMLKDGLAKTFPVLNAAWERYRKSWVSARMWPFSSYLPQQQPGLMGRVWPGNPTAAVQAQADQWMRWMAMCVPQGRYTRRELRAAGLTDDEIDSVMAGGGPTGYREVSIPGTGSEGIQGDGQPPLKRRMSYVAAADKPPMVSGKRRFFRTWIRAEKKRKA